MAERQVGDGGGGGKGRKEGEGTPLLQWLASGIGLVLTAGAIGFQVWSGMRDSGPVPEIAVEVRRVVEAETGFVAEIVARNRAGAVGATVHVRGELSRDGSVVESSETVFDYVPGRSERSGGLFFRQDPRGFEFEVRALGYVEP